MTKLRLNGVFMRHFVQQLVACIMLASALFAHADGGDADVIKVNARDGGEAGWSFDVTVEHKDTGWSDYCDGWDVLLEDGTVLKRSNSDQFTRLLLHPHETEQPFTRSQGGLSIPDGTRYLTVRAHDLVDGFGGKEVQIDLQSDSGPGYAISR